MAAQASKFDRLPKAFSAARNLTASKVVVVFLIGGLLYFAHTAFVPVALALLSALILSSPVEWLHHRGVSRGIGAGLILVMVIGFFAGIASLAWAPAQSWYASAPTTLSVIQRKITPVARLVKHIEDLTEKAGSVAVSNVAGTQERAVAVVQQSASNALLATARDSAIGLATFIVLTLFLLAGGPPMVARMTAAFFDHLKANHVLRTIEKVRGEVGHFYVTLTLINVGLAIATTLLMWLWGMPTPYLWGALAGLLNFIPYAGPTATLFVLTLVALVSFEGIGQAVVVALSYVALASVEGQLIQPLLLGRRLQVNPLLIFLGLWFGSLFWGIAGLILSTPILVALKVVAENSIDGQSLVEFLGPNKPMTNR